MKRILGVIVAPSVLAVAACGGGETRGASQAAAKPAQTGQASAGGAEFGVPECDQYVKAYLACVESKVPTDVRGQLTAAFDQTRAQWKQAATTPQGKTALATMCTQARDMARSSMQPYGCTF